MVLYRKVFSFFCILFCFTYSLKTQILINEIVTSNVNGEYDPDFGLFSDWIEIYNMSDEAMELTGFSLSDNSDEIKKWIFPEGTTIQANSYEILWADDYDLYPGEKATRVFSSEEIITVQAFHLNFQLSREGENVSLYNPEGILLDIVHIPEIIRDLSFGRDQTDTAKWKYFHEPTPGQLNSSFGMAIPVFSGLPSFSSEGGLYKSGETLELSFPDAGAVIRYTNDGSVPDHNSAIYDAPINLNFSRVIKARVFEEGKFPGEVVTHSYIINKSTKLPIISVTSDYRHLWDFTFGIYQNSLKNREIPIHIEYFDTAGVKQFQVNAGAELFGSQIFQLDQKPLDITFKKKYGSSSVNYQIFKDKNILSFKNFVLRNGGNDYNNTMFRDGLGACIVKNQMNIDYQDYNPAVVYLNGQYWGIYNIREKLNKNYLADNHDINPDYIDLIEDSLDIKEGDKNSYEALIKYVELNDMSNSEHYENVVSQIDVDEYLNYMIFKIYAGYLPWMVNNKYWRQRSNDGKWRWIAHDLEHGMGGPGSDNFSGNTLQKIIENDQIPEWSVILFNELLKNEDFSNEFIQRTAVLLNTSFNAKVIIPKVDSIRTLIVEEMDDHILKWQSPVSMMAWDFNINYMKDFILKRNKHIYQHYFDMFSINDTVSLTIKSSSGGKVMICGKYFNKQTTFPVFHNIPIKIKAIPNPGYKFVSWNNSDTDDEIVFNPQKDTSLMAYYTLSSSNYIRDTIKGLVELTTDHSPYFASDDIIVPVGNSLIINEGVTVLMPVNASIYVYGIFHAIGTENNPIVLDINPYASAKSYNVSGNKWGAICSDNAEDTVKIIHAKILNASHGKDQLKYKAAISTNNSNLILDHIEIPKAENPVYCNGGKIAITNTYLHSEDVCDLINLYSCDSALIKDCTLKGNYAEDADAIDLDNVTNSLVERNYVHSFFGFNSDGIDLGEECSNILLKNNKIFSCNDKGFSIGEKSDAKAENNIIVNCGQGFGIKDSGSCFINQNTLYLNKTGIACFEKTTGKGGGSVEVINSIISGSSNQTLFTDNISDIVISFSISDKDTLPGMHNLLKSPQFEQAAIHNFTLLPTSPCIDAGSPLYTDPDSTIADMGAYFNEQVKQPALCINEFYCSDAINFTLGDWIEFYNNSDSILDISGWIVKDKNDDNEYIFPKNTTILPHDYLVLGNLTDSLIKWKKEVHNVHGDFNYGLSSLDEIIRIYNADYQLQQSFSYNQQFQMDYINNMGSSMEFSKVSSDINNPVNWHPGYKQGGSPGESNSIMPNISGLYINEIMAKNDNTISDDYNEFDDWLEIYNSNDFQVDVGGLYLTKKFTNSKLFRIPFSIEETKIPAKGFLLLWADKDRNQGISHMSFTLDAKGDEVGLVQYDGFEIYIIDSLSYENQKADISYGYYPDGFGDLLALSPTPRASNIILDIPDNSLVKDEITLFPNPFNEELIIKLASGISKKVNIQVYNSQGISINNISVSSFDEQTIIIQTGSFLPGIYYIVISKENGAMISGKVIKAINL